MTQFDTFIEELTKIFGQFNPSRRSFKDASNSDIARALCYSDSQFSRLINKTASDGEYERAIQNVKRKQIEIGLTKASQNLSSKTSHRKFLNTPVFILFAALIVLTTFYLFQLYSFDKSVTSNDSKEDTRKGMLEWIFETSVISPYTTLSELPADCDYPCYRYQGTWELKNPYKIPIIREQSGFHYLAKTATMYFRCNNVEVKDGTKTEGYEYQYHEIWYDRNERDVESFLQDGNSTKTASPYQSLDFESEPSFVKIAKVHTFFKNEFVIGERLMERAGDVIGRDIEYISDDALRNENLNEAVISELKKEVNVIALTRLRDFSRPITCKPSKLPREDFNNVKEGDALSFTCNLTTANAPIEYTKTYQLTQQFIKTACRVP